jgi:hypothetical protein
MDANKQLHDACPVFHSNLLSACRLLMVTSFDNLTAHLTGECALRTALKMLINANILNGNGYLAMYSMTKFTNDCQNRINMLKSC